MKPSLLFLLILLVSSWAIQKGKAPRNLYFDENQEPVSKGEFNQKWKDPENPYTRWDSIHDGTKYIRLSSPDYEKYQISRSSLMENIEKLSGKNLSDATILLIEYKFKDDLCTSNSSNFWGPEEIRNRKNLIESQKDMVETKYPNLVLLTFFEEGIALSNRPESDEEYFFQDQGNFLRKNIFRHPSRCGSYALIKPNGQVLVRNGESMASYMAAHLEADNWTLFFPAEN